MFHQHSSVMHCQDVSLLSSKEPDVSCLSSLNTSNSTKQLAFNESSMPLPLVGLPHSMNVTNGMVSNFYSASDSLYPVLLFSLKLLKIL